MQKKHRGSLWEVVFDMHKHLEKQLPDPGPHVTVLQAREEHQDHSLISTPTHTPTAHHSCKPPFARNLQLQANPRSPGEMGSLRAMNQ